MAIPFVGEIKLVSWNYPPKGWAFCNGQLLSIAQNQALFTILGTTYGGNGTTNFAVPDLRGRVPNSFGEGFLIGEMSGQESHTLFISELPAHSHLVNASNTTSGNVTSPVNNYFSNSAPPNIYSNVPGGTILPPTTITPAGGNQPHTNMQPFLVLNFCIALSGIFPSAN